MITSLIMTITMMQEATQHLISCINHMVCLYYPIVLKDSTGARKQWTNSDTNWGSVYIVDLKLATAVVLCPTPKTTQKTTLFYA